MSDVEEIEERVPGYVKLYRQTVESEVWENPGTLKVFIWALFHANYNAWRIRFHGECYELQAGQFISG